MHEHCDKCLRSSGGTWKSHFEGSTSSGRDRVLRESKLMKKMREQDQKSLERALAHCPGAKPNW
jgi:hypothetical protein